VSIEPSGVQDAEALTAGADDGSSSVDVPAEPDEPTQAPLLSKPAGGLPPVTQSADALADDVERFAASHGPVALDTERAGGHRYSQRAYLVQARRRGAGTSLIDPIACPDLSGLADAISDAEWVLHSASQDLPALVEIGMTPTLLFDTELAARLLDRPKVGLASLMETDLGVHLAKEHSAVDWSRRPIPPDWLTYAALDVELLLELRDILAADLVEAGKDEWARQEFAALVDAPPPAPRHEPWRRTSGMHKVRGARRLALVRALWEERDRVAAERDITPTRVLPDAAIVAAAQAGPVTADELGALPGFRGRAKRARGRGELRRWAEVLRSASALPDSQLPSVAAQYDGPPPARAWADRDPVAAGRLSAARTALGEIAEANAVPVENLLTPDTLRRLLWQPPDDAASAAVADRLRVLGAREWQVSLVADTLATVLAEPVPSLVTGE
jgi:ribonuclease D